MADIGRPSIYTPELAERICLEMAKGRSLRAICQDEGMPARSTVHLWEVNNVDGFSDRYARAQFIRVLEMADETLDIADNASNDWMATNDPENSGFKLNGEAVARSRLRVDTRKWMSSKLAPKLFGDKLTHANDPENPLPDGSGAVDKLAAALDRLSSRQSAG